MIGPSAGRSLESQAHAWHVSICVRGAFAAAKVPGASWSTNSESVLHPTYSANVPLGAIGQHTKANFGGTDFSEANAITHRRGFWGHLFGTTSDDDGDVYNRSIERGSTVVTVRVSEEDVDRVSEIMESHGPIDLGEESTEDVPHAASVSGGDLADARGMARTRCYVVGTSDVSGKERPTRKPQ